MRSSHLARVETLAGKQIALTRSVRSLLSSLVVDVLTSFLSLAEFGRDRSVGHSLACKWSNQSYPRKFSGEIHGRSMPVGDKVWKTLRQDPIR